MEDNFKDYIHESKEVITDYLEARWRLTRLTAAGKMAHALGVFMVIIIAAMLGFFVVMFLGLLLAYWISDMTGSFTLGFSMAALLFIVLLAVVLFFRRRLIQKPVSNVLLRELAEESEDMDISSKDS